MIAFEDMFGPKRFVLMALSGIYMTFWLYQERAPEHDFVRACNADLLAKGETRAKATARCNCVTDKSKRWFAQNPESAITQSVVADFHDRCTGDYYLRRQEARQAAEEAGRERSKEGTDWGVELGGEPGGGWGE